MSTYTAISFAPVQGFIEKSRKLRDLYGASLILSYLSFKLVEQFEQRLGAGCVISPGLITVQEGIGLITVQEGMPNRILVKGDLNYDIAKNTLLQEWQRVLRICREWIEDNVGIAKAQYHWAQKEEQIGQQKGEWERWGSYTWEVFWGTGDSPEAAMVNLETRKLKRDWIGINWTGESSSLTGTDAIAWPRLGEVRDSSHSLNESEKKELTVFYRQLAWVLDDPYQRSGKIAPVHEEPEGKYIAANERLSIPELVKRLVTLPKVAKKIGMTVLDEGFKDIVREQGHWTGWFMGDGDKVGNYLKTLRSDAENQTFSEAMRNWGKQFKDEFPDRLGRVIYAGGDDFLGVLYSDRQGYPVPAPRAFEWLTEFPTKWQEHQQPISVSVGFVWAANRVPQRDVLQHCREAEKRSKNLGRNRLTIRIVFNSGQSVQWTCPWEYLKILTQYQDREGGQNWTHVYSDWATLKARHAIQLTETDKQSADSYLARQLFDFYFDKAAQTIDKNPPDKRWKYVAGDNSELAIVQWIDDLIQVGWHLCSNT